MVNAKGGVGKTICSVNLAASLALRNKRCLVIDIDPQCSASSLLLGDQIPQNTLHNLIKISMAPPAEPGLFNTPPPSPTPSTLSEIEQCIYPTIHGVDILPNSPDCASLEFKLYQNPTNYGLLRTIIRSYANENYDYVILDCPPTIGAIWVIMALVCADAVIVPVSAGSRMSLDGLSSVYESVKSVAAEANAELKFLKVLINKVDLRTSASKLIVETLKKRYPGQVFAASIPSQTAIEQSEIFRTTVLKHDGACNASKRFRLLADELIELTNG
jgi:cellulose biosynthesis protein BcsQ